MTLSKPQRILCLKLLPRISYEDHSFLHL
jgi:hypothetical protein